MSLRHPKPAPATPSAGKRTGALPIRCELLLVATLEDAGELVLLASIHHAARNPTAARKKPIRPSRIRSSRCRPAQAEVARNFRLTPSGIHPTARILPYEGSPWCAIRNLKPASLGARVSCHASRGGGRM
jgi:hypothetical protein